MSDDAWINEILPNVQRPARYIGGEWNETVKDHRDVALTFALAFPDVYEIGMSHLGYRILYSMLNGREERALEVADNVITDLGHRVGEDRSQRDGVGRSGRRDLGRGKLGQRSHHVDDVSQRPCGPGRDGRARYEEGNVYSILER